MLKESSMVHVDLQLDNMEKLDIMVQDKFVPIPHIEFLIPEVNNVEIKVFQFHVLPKMIHELTQVILILQHFKTQGQVFSN